MRTRAFTYVIGAVLSVALVACSGGSGRPSSGTKENTAANAVEGMSCGDPNMPVGEWRKRCAGASPTAAASAATVVGIGEPGTVDSSTGGVFGATLRRVVDPAPAANPYAGASSGKRYVALLWKIDNTGSTTLNASDVFSSHIVDDQGEWELAAPATIAAGGTFPSAVRIPPGQSLEAFLVYQLPQNAKPVTVEFLPGFGKPVVKWRLT